MMNISISLLYGSKILKIISLKWETKRIESNRSGAERLLPHIVQYNNQIHLQMRSNTPKKCALSHAFFENTVWLSASVAVRRCQWRRRRRRWRQSKRISRPQFGWSHTNTNKLTSHTLTCPPKKLFVLRMSMKFHLKSAAFGRTHW